MTLVISSQVSAINSAVYDGTNAVELLAEFNAVVRDETGGVLTYADNEITSTTYTINEGQRLFWAGLECAYTFVGDDLLAFPYVVIPMGGTSQSFVSVTGSAAVAAGGLLGQTQTLDVTLSGTLDDASYVPLPFLRGAPNIISGHGILSAVALNASTARVVVQSGPASLVGATLFVVAHGFQST